MARNIVTRVPSAVENSILLGKGVRVRVGVGVGVGLGLLFFRPYCRPSRRCKQALRARVGKRHRTCRSSPVSNLRTQSPAPASDAKCTSSHTNFCRGTRVMAIKYIRS
jgi:hypothetical protein